MQARNTGNIFTPAFADPGPPSGSFPVWGILDPPLNQVYGELVSSCYSIDTGCRGSPVFFTQSLPFNWSIQDTRFKEAYNTRNPSENICILCMKMHLNILNYRPQTKFAKVMFSQASVCPQGGVCPIACWDTPPWTRGRHPPGADTPPRCRPPQIRPPGPEVDTPLEQTPPPRSRPPRAGTPLGADTPPPLGAVYAGRYGQQAGGTHPTGMHTCIIFETIANNLIILRKKECEFVSMNSLIVCAGYVVGCL